MTHPSQEFLDQLKLSVSLLTHEEEGHLIATAEQTLLSGRKGIVPIEVAQHFIETRQWVDDPVVCEHEGCVRPPHEVDGPDPDAGVDERKRMWRSMSLSAMYSKARRLGYTRPIAHYN